MAVVALVVLLAFSSSPVAAFYHNEDEAWTYDVIMDIDVGSFIIRVSGNMTYEFRERGTLIVESEEYDTNVLSVEGELSGSMELFGEPFIDASIVVDGFLFETLNGGGTIKEQTDMLIDATFGSGSSSWSLQQTRQSIVTYTPPYLSQLSPASNQLGNHWTEQVYVNSSSTSWNNGTDPDTWWNGYGTTFDITVGGNSFGVGTPAGNFTCISIEVVDWGGDYDVLWWSNDVHGIVIKESYWVGEEWPNWHESMILAKYRRGDTDSILWVVVVGICVAVVAMVVLFLVLLRTRIPKDS